MSAEPGGSEGEELRDLGDKLLAALRRYHRGLARLEVECFMLPPRPTVKELVPERVEIIADGADRLLQADPWWFRCRRDKQQRWRVHTAGRSCPTCAGYGTCCACASRAEPEDGCACGGTGFCAPCEGIGKLIFF